MMKNKYFQLTIGLLSLAFLANCGSETPTFSLASVQGTYQQTTKQIAKVDILWVVDNSGSMAPAQTSLANNFESFINNFTQQDQEFDFQIAVTTSQAYRSNPTYYSFITEQDYSRSEFVVGNGIDTNSGVKVITNATPNLNDIFLTNVNVGTLGSGDERALSSLEETLKNPLNAGFVRENSFLAVIVVSDENDFSWDGTTRKDTDPNDPDLHPVSRYKSFLDNLTGETDDRKKYLVSSIHVKNNDSDCLASSHAAAKYGSRYEELVEATGGSTISICDTTSDDPNKFANSLSGLSEHIIRNSLIKEFELDREPKVETLVVQVNGVAVPMATDTVDGWSYQTNDDGKYILSFRGDAVPGPDSSIDIAFDPAKFE